MATTSDDRPRCPNCRGPGRLIAFWNYIDHDRITQYINGVGGAQVDNQLASPSSDGWATPIRQLVEQPAPNPTELITPRSMNTTHDWQTPEHPQSFHGSDGSYVTLPSTFRDFDEWIAMRTGTGFGPERQDIQQPSPPADQTNAFHTTTRLADGRPSILIDPGSVGNLGGDEWAKSVARAALQHHRKPEQKVRDRPLDVSGVGNGSQQCTHNCTLPIALKRLDDTHSGGTFEIPVVNKSKLPGLLGLHALRARNAILDLKTLQIHLCGPGDYDLPQYLPPGTESFQCEIAPSGHMVLPCCNYSGVDQEESGRLDTGPQLSLVTSSSSL